MSLVTADELIEVALRELDWSPPSPMATIRLGERVTQLGDALQAVGRRELHADNELHEAAERFHAQRISETKDKPTLGAIRRRRKTVDEVLATFPNGGDDGLL